MQVGVAPPPPAGDTPRKSSLETEPRTLYEEQIAEAQDAAIDVLETKEPEEALEIFTTPTVEVQQSRENEENKAMEESVSERQELPPAKVASAPF